MSFNTCDIGSITEASAVEVGRDYAEEHVLISIPHEKGKGILIAFTPEEAESTIRGMRNQLEIIYGTKGVRQ